MLDQWRAVLPAIGFSMQGVALAIAVYYLLPSLRSWLLPSLATTTPGPVFVLPVIGESPMLIRSPILYMWRRWLKYGNLFKTHLLGFPLYVVSGPALLRSLWSDDDAFDFFVPGKAFSLLITDLRHMQDPQQHAYFRRKVGQALTPASLGAHLLPLLSELFTARLDRWERKGRVQLTEECAALSLDVALDVVSGNPVPPGLDRDLVLRLYRTTLDGLYGMPVNLPGTALHAAVRARARLIELLGPSLEAEAAELAATLRAEAPTAAEGEAAEGGPGAGEAGGGAGPRAPSGAVKMMDGMVASCLPYHGKLSRELVFERALGTVIASDDTSRHLFLMVIICTALAADVRARLEQEQLQAMRLHGDDLSYTVLNSMPYLDAVVKETIRLFPIAIGGFRTAKKDVQLGGTRIPRGSVLFWSTHLAHASDAALLPRTLPTRRTSPTAPAAASASAPTSSGWAWPGSASARQRRAQPPAPVPRVAKPDLDSPGGRAAVARVTTGPTGLPSHMDFEARFDEAFRPERWLSEETRPAAFAGFGGGQHLCLGMNLAYAEVKLLLSLLLRRFEYRMEDPALLRKAALFPGPRPKRGTDGLLLTPRPLRP